MEPMTLDRLGEIEAAAHKGVPPSAATALALVGEIKRLGKMFHDQCDHGIVERIGRPLPDLSAVHADLLRASRDIGPVRGMAQWATIELAELVRARIGRRPLSDLSVGELVELIAEYNADRQTMTKRITFHACRARDLAAELKRVRQLITRSGL